MFNLSTGELIIVLIIVLLVFGASRLPELGKGLGQGMRSFKDALKNDEKPASGSDSKPSASDPKVL